MGRRVFLVVFIIRRMILIWVVSVHSDCDSKVSNRSLKKPDAEQPKAEKCLQGDGQEQVTKSQSHVCILHVGVRCSLHLNEESCSGTHLLIYLLQHYVLYVVL